jgi:hypothetical protein
MRLCIAAALALSVGAFGWAQAQTSLAQPPTSLAQAPTVVPPAPPIVASPLPSPQATPQVQLPSPPPGLVQTPFPPAAPVAPAAPVSPSVGAVPGTAPIVAPPSEAPSGPAASTPTVVTPGAAVPATPGQATQAPAAPAIADTAPVVPNTWVAGKTVTIGVLDKVDGSIAQVSIPVGGQQTIGDLQVSVQACVNRPSDQLPDAAIFLTVQSPSDSADAPLFRGWMVRSTPGAMVVGDAGETFRVVGCSQ